MAFVITQNCCNDASCVSACPVGCIHPTPDEPGFATAEMLYIDPATCIDCGACADACPVDAIRPESKLAADSLVYRELNADYYRDNPLTPSFQRKGTDTLVTSATPLSVAIVGSGPAGMYCAKELLKNPGVRVEMIERLDVPFGLIRYGVAPDHAATKAAVRQFDWSPEKQTRFRLTRNTEVGRDLSHADLLARHDAVIYAHGAFNPRRLELPGAALPNSIPAGTFVGWYNDHPDQRSAEPDLSGRQAVIIGNGNVALDMARILLSDPDRLADTPIAENALTALRHSGITDVHIVGRRGAEHAGFTTPEFLALVSNPALDIIVDPTDISNGSDREPRVRRKLKVLAEVATRPQRHVDRRIHLHFGLHPVEILGETTARGARFTDGNGVATDLAASLVLHAVGFEGKPIPGVPFDDERHVIPNLDGRVIDPATGAPLPGVYTAGWIKRGPSGVIGTNRTCAVQTVGHLLDDHRLGRLPQPKRRRSGLGRLLARAGL